MVDSSPHDIPAKLRLLSKRELQVLELRCQGMKYLDIGNALHIAVPTVKTDMGRVYMKLGLDVIQPSQRLKALYDTVCPVLQVIKTEMSKAGTSPATTPPAPDVVDGEVVSEKEVAVPPEVEDMVDEDDKAIVPSRPAPVVPPPPPRRQWWPVLLGFGVVLGACVGAVVVYLLLRSSGGPLGAAPPLAPAVTAFPANQDAPTTPPEAPLLVPTKTSEPAPTSTPLPTNTAIPLPTPTAKPYYEQGETVILQDGIYMSLSEDFLRAGGLCGKPDPGFGVRIIIKNTISEQFLVRLNTGDFHARDNLGNEYKLVAIGNNGDGFCTEPIGVPSEYMMSYGYWTSYIPMQFKGQVPLEATYLLITADWISGVGPTVFRKDL